MPEKRKSAQEKAIEGHFTVSKENLKYTTEKLVREKPSIEEILKRTTEKEVREKQEKAPTRTAEKKKSKKQKTKKTTSKQETYLPPELSLKEKGYELIITEKPQAALKIAAALGAYEKKNIKNVPYYELDRDGKKIIVACAVGHLFTLRQKNRGAEIPEFEISWVPNFYVRKKDFSKRYYEVLLKLAKKAGELTVATDYDIEGELIGINVVKLICNQPDAKRMKFSTLTNKELNESYEKRSDSINWGQAIAGETRHYLDWFYGINLSRALMDAIKKTGKFKIMSIGRVQGPTLKLIVEKEKQIQNFKPQTYYQTFIKIKDPELELKHPKDIFEKELLKKFESLIGEKINLSTKKSEQKLPPNPPFNLTQLQTECYKLFNITPQNSLKIAQSLYLAGLISYPRTSSQKLPESIDYKSILEKLKIKYKVASLIKRDKPVQGNKTDPAHPSIYPTGNEQKLIAQEQKVYDLIVKRFLALFCEDAIIEKKRISGKVKDLDFSANGQEIKKKTWTQIYPTAIKENKVPIINGEKEIIDQKFEEKETQPPKRYSPASIISELEKRNLGTKATRAQIIETLYDRGYIKETSIQATPIGMSLVKTLEKYSPIIIDEKLTKSVQDEMDGIVESKEKHLEQKEQKILNESKETIKEIIKQFKEKEEKIGEELIEAQQKLRKQEQKENTLNLCPECKQGNLRITYSPKNKKHFIACSAYPKCKNTYSLPPYGAIKPTGKDCEKCGFPLLMSLQKGKRPWIFCFNPECETNKKRLEEYYQKKKEQENKVN
jgi:DNA topoisomerase I